MQTKKLIYKILTLSLLSASLFSFVNPAHADDVNTSKLNTLIATKKSHPNQTNLLLFQKSDAAKIIPNEGSQNCYNLVLTDTQHNIIYFSDQPARIAGSISVPQFLALWQQNYTQDRFEPNVVINATIADNNGNKINEMTDIAVFSHPVYDQTNNQLSYTVCSISKNKISDFTRLTNVSLFFDPIHRWPD